MRVLGIALTTLGFAVLGLVLGYGLGALAGVGWVEVMHTSSFEGYSGMLVFFGFAPAGALLGSVALPALYLVHRAKRRAR